MRSGRWLMLLTIAVLAIATVVLVIFTLRRGDHAPPAAFVVLVLVALGWNSYWSLFRIAVELIVDEESIVSISPLRTRRIPTSALVAVRPMKLLSNVVIIEVAEQRPIVTLAVKGITALTNELARRRPSLPIRLGWQARLAERLPGRSRLEDAALREVDGLGDRDPRR